MMSKVDKNIAAQDWFYDRYLAREVESQRYFILSCLLGALLSLTLILLFFLFPLKRTIMEPYVVLIDDVHGITSTLTAAKSVKLEDHIPIVRYFLAKYVQSRESHNDATINAQFDLVRAFSSPDAFKVFQNEWKERFEKASKDNLDANKEIKVDILSVTFPSSDIAHVRYNSNERSNGISIEKNTWLSTLKIAQVNEVDDALAVLNPLGMVIINYKTVRESNHESD